MKDENNLEKQITHKNMMELFLYNVGFFTILIAMAIFLNQIIKSFSYPIIFCVGILYTFIFYFLANIFHKKQNSYVATLSYCLFIFMSMFDFIVIEKAVGIYPHHSETYKYVSETKFATILYTVFASIVAYVTSIYRKYNLIKMIFIFSAIISIRLILSFGVGDFYETYFLKNFLIDVLLSIGLFICAYLLNKKQIFDYSSLLCTFASIIFFPTFIYFLYSILNIKSVFIIETIIIILSIIYLYVSKIIKNKTFAIVGSLGILAVVLNYEYTFLYTKPLLFSFVLLVTGVLIFFISYNFFKNKI